MTQEMYSIKEAAKALGVETHALRFWEEELELHVARNAQGRRMYSEENMQEFRRIMEWKRQGLQLKAIKPLVHREAVERGYHSEVLEEIEEAQMPWNAAGHMSRTMEEEEVARRIIVYRPKESVCEEPCIVQAQSEPEAMQSINAERVEKARRLQELLKQFIAESIRESNTELLQGLKEGLLKELDYQFRLQEEREEEREKIRIEKEDEHFRQLDENLRSAMEKKGRKKRKGMFTK